MMQKYDFTIDPNFINSYEKLKSQNQGILVRALDTNSTMWMVNLHAFGTVDALHLHEIPSSTRDHAFELRMRMMLDDAETQIEQLMIKKVLRKARGVSKIMGEADVIRKRIDHFHETVSALKKSKDVLANVAP
ncbi:hypothetical protein Tco_0411384 [Tanacetum coccineum]